MSHCKKDKKDECKDKEIERIKVRNICNKNLKSKNAKINDATIDNATITQLDAADIKINGISVGCNIGRLAVNTLNQVFVDIGEIGRAHV